MQFYFGFGANRSADMIRAITGRSAIGVPAQIMHFQLCIESLRNIPLRARHILAEKWNENFVSYGIVPKREQQVRGHLWLLTDRQRECVRQWELVGAWSQDVCVTAYINFFGLRIAIPAVSEALLQQKVTPVDGAQYETFIVPKEQILRIAESVRAFA